MNKTKLFLSLLRISLGLIFLWAFFDKLFGFGLATPLDKGWIEGNSPTYGFLTHATKGPFASLYKSIAGNLIVDILFMSGMLLIGLTLLFGILVNIASMSGSLMMFFIWLAELPPQNHPFLDEHIIYVLVFLLFIFNDSGYLGFGKWWKNRKIVKRFGFLR